jgi:UDP-N-acetylglucosamine acyltransferase
MKSSFIHPTATLFEGKVILGKNVYIGAGCTIGGPPEHSKVNPLKPESYSVVIIGDNVKIMNGVNIDSGYQRPTEIKEGSFICSHSYIAHDCIIEPFCTISSGAILGGHSHIKRNANIGINATLHQFTEVGEGTIVGAGCFAKGVLEPWSKYHTGIAAKNKGENTHAIERVKRQTPPDYVI